MGAYCKNSDCALEEIGKFRPCSCWESALLNDMRVHPPTALDDTVFRWSVKELIAPKEFV